MAHRFDPVQRQSVDDGWLPPGETSATASATEAQGQRLPPTEIREVQARTILTGNVSPDIPFDLSLNPYRGCEHGCIYCFARPTHSYLNLSPGLDFETRIDAKVNAAQRLRVALAAKGYEPLALNIGSATDAYQPAERRLRITRQVIEVLAECRHPFSIITKSALIMRDIDLLAPLAAARLAAAYVSLTTLDTGLARILEPRASAPHRRLAAIARLSEAGIAVGVSVSPMIPFINDHELEHLLEAAAAAGASHGFCTPIRLPWEVNPLFQDWLNQHFPDRATRVMARIRDMRGGQDNDPRFGSRMTGTGIWADLLRQRFVRACRAHGLSMQRIELDASQFRPPQNWAAHPHAGSATEPSRSAQAAVAGSQAAQMALF